MLGTLLGGRYKIINVLGAGGFGQTYLAEDAEYPGERKCVIKQFKPVSRDTKFLEVARRLFNTEVEALRKLGQHDQIPELFGFFEENREFYLVQEFIDGDPLSDEISRASRLNEAETVALLRDVLHILEYVHSHGVIHRDIKPGNLIRRRQDGKVVLIDFGAVKEMHTQLQGESGQTGFTVGIGTQGYTPSEQLLGKPKFCSDLYALGVTAIQALTGLQPSQLPEDPDTSELIWEDYTSVSPALAFILNQMVRYHYSQRYQSASEVLRALDRMSELATDLTSVPRSLLPSLLLPDSLLRYQTQMEPGETWRNKVKSGAKAIALTTLAVTSLLVGVGKLGWMQPMELSVYDRLVRLRGSEPPDSRLLVVAITEKDLQALKRPTPSDESVAKVIETLNQHQPRAIGLDLYRDLPQQPGREALLQQLQADNVIAITQLGTDTDRVPPPPTVPQDRIGFNDFAADTDGVIRRNLIFGSDERGTHYSFALRLGLKYLAAEDIKPLGSRANPDHMELNQVVFRPLNATSGGYQEEEVGKGYQILLNYRSATDVAPQVSFTEVLKGQIDPKLVQDKIVLIGTTAPSGKDLFYTPFSAGQRTDHQMPGVIVHAQMVSQLLSAVLDQRRPFWFWPDLVEILWLAGWAAAGGAVAWFVRRPAILVISSIGLVVVLSGATILIFFAEGWIPLAAPAIALVIGEASVLIYRLALRQYSYPLRTQLLWHRDATRTVPKQ